MLPFNPNFTTNFDDITNESSDSSLLPHQQVTRDSKKANKQSNYSKRSVSFKQEVKVLHGMTLNEYSDEEFAQCFFQTEDYDRFNKSSLKTIKHIECQTVFKQNKRLCIRGLERYTSYMISLRSEKRDVALDVVYSMQLMPDYMAKYLSSLSSSCQLQAQVRGKKDEATALSLSL